MSIYWFTGQPASGKTTLVNNLLTHFGKDNTIIIDGDDLRDIFQNKDYSEVGRRKNIERAQDISQFLNKKGFTVLVSLVSPYKDQREDFKNREDVIEVYVHTTEDRGRNQFHVENYEPPTENFIDLDTTDKTEVDSYYEILKKFNLKATTQHLIRLLCTIQLFTNTRGSPAIAVHCLHACAFKCASQACSDNLSCI